MFGLYVIHEMIEKKKKDWNTVQWTSFKFLYDKNEELTIFDTIKCQ